MKRRGANPISGSLPALMKKPISQEYVNASLGNAIDTRAETKLESLISLSQIDARDAALAGLLAKEIDQG